MAGETYLNPLANTTGVATSHGGGSDQPWLKHSGSVTQDIYGEEYGMVVWQVLAGNWADVPDKNSTTGGNHPHASYLKFEDRTVTMNSGIWEVKVNYRGIKPVYHEGGTPPVYELNYGSGTEPIETHPNFESDIGGKPSAPKNGAVFVDAEGNVTTDDDVGVFDKFLIKNPDKDRSFGGVDSYLDMNNITWTKTWVTRTMSGLEGSFVNIEDPEDSASEFTAPKFKGRDWLYLGCNSTGVRGDSARHRKTWRLSGPGKWNEVIYKATI